MNKAFTQKICYHPPMLKKEHNEAFIDSQNLHLGIRHLGWTLDSAKFRQFLRDEYGVEKAYMFIGFREEYTELYADLQSAGFILVLKPTIKARDGTVKGNCDADLVLQAMIDLPVYDKAVIVTGDGDFASLVRYLRERKKLKCLLAPDKNRYSSLLGTAADGFIAFLSDERTRLAGPRPVKTLPGETEMEEGADVSSDHLDAPAPLAPVPPAPVFAQQPVSKPKTARRRGKRGGRRHRRKGKGEPSKHV